MLTTASPNIFVGRDEILETLNKRVESLKSGYRQNVALTGQKLCGKTAILQHFLTDLKTDSVVPVYMEVLGEPLDVFCRKFIGTLLFNFLKISEVDEIKEDMGFLVKKAEPQIPRTVAYIKDIFIHLEKGDFQEAYSNLFNLAPLLKEEARKSCIIILDEFHNLSSFDIKNPFGIFGKKIMVQKDTMYIVTSSQVSTIKKILKERLDLLFGNFEIIEIKDFEYGLSRVFLEKRLEGLKIQEELKDFLIYFTDGRPYYLDMIASELNSISSQMQFKWVSPGLISQALDNLLFDSRSAISQYFQNLLSGFAQGPQLNRYSEILSAIAGQNKRLSQIRSGFSGKKNELPLMLNRLMEENIISKNGLLYYFNDRVFEFWIRFVYNKKKYSLISNFRDRANLFRRETEDLISLFLAENKNDIQSRLKDLIYAFNKEVLKIGERNFKLPKFSAVETVGLADGDPGFILRALYSPEKFWIVRFCPHPIDETAVINWKENNKADATPPQRKILIAFSGIDSNAMLMAKENKIWVWGKEELNLIFSLYNKLKILK